MANFFIVQSRDPYTDARAKADYELISHLVIAGNNVRVLLIQNGVLPARKGSIQITFDAMCAQKINLLADNFSLVQREIDFHNLKDGVQVGSIDLVTKAMLDGDKVIWH